TDADIEAAAAYIENDPRIRIVLITGGDPLTDLPLLKKTLDRIGEIKHVTALRIGTRNILFKPKALTDEVAEFIASYNRIDCDNLRLSKSIAIGFSLNHPDEISPDVARAVRRLVSRGIV